MSQTAAMELPRMRLAEDAVEKLQAPNHTHRRSSHSSKASGHGAPSDQVLPSPIPSTAGGEAPRWNDSSDDVVRVLCCFYGLFLMGVNDGAYGALIPYLEIYYNLSYTVVSLVFLTPFVGYVLASLSNNFVHVKLGQRGIAVLAPCCRILAYAVLSAHPPFPAVAVILVFAGYGIGLEDAGWNSWIGAMANSNQLLGCLHAFYGLGATVSPLLATALITKANWLWSSWYFIPLGAAIIELVVDTYAFWDKTGAKYRASIASSSAAHGRNSESKSILREVLFHPPGARITWVCALFLFGYVGIEVALGGWIVTFMRRVRGGKPFQSGIVATGFWLGITVGRVTLGFITPLIGEKLAICIYLVATMGIQLIFWLVPSFVVSAVFVGLEGFFLGPLFPSAVVAVTKLLPSHLHVPVLGFAVAFGGCGAAAFPFIVGAVASATSVRALQPIILAMLACILIVWLGLPGMNKRRD